MKNPCNYCKLAEVRPDYPRHHGGCRTCGVRELANSPLFHQSGLYGTLSSGYRKALAGIFGDGWQQGHDQVKAVAKRIKDGRSLL